ncbi:MAG: ATP-binding cassette domain-containing protein, partial [Leptospiraceae bacterium]|nr:ATP-binding cassette domain-containing protein [Leptospiraceae bacterium]
MEIKPGIANAAAGQKPGQQQALLHYAHCSIHLPDRVLLHDFSFAIPEGARSVITGKSGSGKSTILRSIIGLILTQNEAARIQLRSLVLRPDTVSQFRQQIAYVPQELLEHGSVQAVLDRPFRFKCNQTKRPDRRLVLDHLAALALRPQILNQSFSALSGGEKRRVAILVAALLDRPLWLIDEPLNGLDPESR